ncbi:MAG: hypothetical protein KDB03_08545, partial [Planctomycetales bacterium]|nr:hypothetical protein [Planctomycetales bacterium]
MQPIETAFGRPARWRGAIPAVAVGFGSLLLGIYSIFVLPERLRPQYLASLSSAQAEYRELTESTTPFVSWRLGEVAGDLDVIFSRLIGLEAGQPERYWEWAEFLETHTKNLDKRLQDSAASVQDDVKTRLEKQAREFDAKALELYHQLASGQSIFQPRALLREAEHFYVQGIASLGVDDNSGLTDKLRDLWNESTDQSSEFRDSAQLMLVRMLIENAWQHSDGSRLIFQPKPAREALDVCQDKTYQSVSKQHQARIQAASSLLQAMLGDLNDENTLSVVNDLEEFISVDFSDEWNDQLAELELAMLDSDWPKISYVLSKKSI